MPVESLESWINGLQAKGRYTFLRSEALRDSGLSDSAVARALHRAVKNGRLLQPKEYFHVIVPLEYRAAGAPPVFLARCLEPAIPEDRDIAGLKICSLMASNRTLSIGFQLHTIMKPGVGNIFPGVSFLQNSKITLR